MYPLSFKQFPVVGRQRRHLAHAVIHDTYLNSLACLLYKQIEYAAPHIAFFNDKILHEDELFSFLQLFEHSLEFVLSKIEICNLGSSIQRETATAAQISAQVVSTRSVMLYLSEYFFRLLKNIPGLVYLLFCHFSRLSVTDIGLCPEQKRSPQRRKK